MTICQKHLEIFFNVCVVGWGGFNIMMWTRRVEISSEEVMAICQNQGICVVFLMTTTTILKEKMMVACGLHEKLTSTIFGPTI